MKEKFLRMEYEVVFLIDARELFVGANTCPFQTEHKKYKDAKIQRRNNAKTQKSFCLKIFNKPTLSEP